ncbi:MAG: 50S ribosomal protein L5 [Patescibacteria group bacterium]|nr:50S ribosomal protein L5 [Patescibacteria group bacterium]MBU2509305.1 50S ribosomal protein L5 [Patescibacteria group bacterium]
MILKEFYKTDIVPSLQKELGIKNKLAVPTVSLISLSVGIPASNKDAKFFDIVGDTLTRITGQKAIKTQAKKSVAGFKTREGMDVGVRVTLRGKRMWDFLDKLINVTLPRVRDFRGISVKSVDGQGNISIGFREFLPFPEISPDEIEKVHGLEVTIATSTKSREKGLILLKSLGFPFKKDS